MLLSPDRTTDTATVAEPPKPQRVLWAERVMYAPNRQPFDPPTRTRVLAHTLNRLALPWEARIEIARAIVAVGGGRIGAAGDGSPIAIECEATISNSEWAAICARYGFKQTAVWSTHEGFWCRVEKAEEA